MMKKILKVSTICCITIFLVSCSNAENKYESVESTSITNTDDVQNQTEHILDSSDLEIKENLSNESTENDTEETLEKSTTKDTIEDIEVSNDNATDESQVGVQVQADFDLLNYLEENFPIDGVHYEVVEGKYLEEYGRADYIVVLRPNTEEDDEYITERFKNSGNIILEEEERISVLFERAESIISLAEKFEFLHIDNVHWTSYDGEFTFLLVQDYRGDLIK